MANYYIGTINPNNLANRGLTSYFGKLSLQTCLISANSYNNYQGTNYNYIAFLPDNPSDNSLQSTGTCTMGNSSYNPLTDNVGNMIGAYRVYKVDSCVDDSCIKSKSKSVLRDSILQQQNTIDSTKTNIDKLEVRLTAIDDNIDEATASSRYTENKQKKNRDQMSNQQQEKLDQYQEFLSDKNRLIASTSSNIQTSTDKLEDLNNKINVANQEIAKNNVEFEQKNKIITSLQAMIGIFFILLLLMIIYYGAIYAKDAYPETYNSVANQITNSFQNLSSFNNN